MNIKTIAWSALLIGQASLCTAATLQEELAEMSRAHEAAIYGTDDIDDRSAAVEALILKATDLHKRYPQSGLAQAWVGWLNMNSAFFQTNPQVSIARFTAARTNLEAALAADENCCGVTGYVSLAILYQFPIPGAPPPGDPQKYFDKALAMEPKGVIPNTRYAGYLMRKGDLEAAHKHATLALAAPPLGAGREGEDKAVRQQAQTFMDQINERRNKK